MSKPFAADHGDPAIRILSCKFRVVKSTAEAGDHISVSQKSLPEGQEINNILCSVTRASALPCGMSLLL